MKAVLALALLAAAVPQVAPAQMPQGGGSAMRRIPGVSDQGNAILDAAMNTPDPALNDLMRQQRQVRDLLVQAATAPSIDVDRVASLFRQREELQSKYRQLLDARLVAALRQLPIADRGPFMRALATPPPGAPR